MGEGEVSLFTRENAGVEEKIELFSIGLLSWGQEQAETWWSVLRESVVGGGSEGSSWILLRVWGGVFGPLGDLARAPS